MRLDEYSMLKSAYHSARIEGNDLTWEEVLRDYQNRKTEGLLPKRAEILRIVKDQKMVSFDQIKRRFMKVNSRTLRYDLKKLQDGGFIKKLGSTRGVYYQAK